MMEEWNYDRELYSAKVDKIYSEKQVEFLQEKIKLIEEVLQKQKSKEKIKRLLK